MEYWKDKQTNVYTSGKCVVVEAGDESVLDAKVAQYQQHGWEPWREVYVDSPSRPEMGIFHRTYLRRA